MTTTLTSKQPSEEYYISFDFEDKLGTEVISAVTSVVAIDDSTLEDVSLTVTDVGEQTNTDTVVYVWVRAGVSGHTYTITCIIKSDADSELELDGLLPVLAKPIASLIITDTECLNFLDVEEDEVVLTIRDAVEDAVSSYCRRNFISTSYKKKYDGTGTPKLLLDDYPVTALTRLSLNYIDVINIKNTSSAYHASVGVNSTGIILTQESTNNSTVLFVTYTTLTAVVTAINLISGWSAQLASSSYGSYPSSILREKFGIYCGQNTWALLSIPDQGEYNFEVDSGSGIVTLQYNFPVGTKNIYVEYIAGYTSATMPEDLKTAVKIWSQVLYRKQQENSFGLTSYGLGGISQSLISEMPKEVELILSNYKRYII